MLRRQGILAVWGAAALLAAVGCGSPSHHQTAPTKERTVTKMKKTEPTPSAAPAVEKSWSSPPSLTIDKNADYTARVSTNYGDFTIDLFTAAAPLTVNNFVFLAEHHFYDGDRFFRVIKSFMVQTGDPNNNGTGGPGYTFPDELPPKYPYAPGIVAMANRGPNTNGSQFFICTGPQSEGLNQTPYYTEFGRVVKGMDVVEKIASVPVTANPVMNGEVSSPTVPVYIKTVAITEKK